MRFVPNYEYRHLTGELTDATIKQMIQLLKGTTQDKLLQKYYDLYKEMGLLNDPADERQFIEEMMIQRHVYDENYVMFAAAAARGKNPINREILKLVRFEGNDGKEYIRFSARFSSQNKHGEPLTTTASKIGVWEEPVFRKKYDRQLEEYMTTLDISHTVPHYEYEWKPEVVNELSKDFSKQTRFMIEDNGGRKYVIDRERWCNDPRPGIIQAEHEAYLTVAKARLR
jgi:hypothetical protein